MNHQNDTGYFDSNVQEEKEKTHDTTERKDKAKITFPAGDIRERKKQENLKKFNATMDKDGKEKTRRQSE